MTYMLSYESDTSLELQSHLFDYAKHKRYHDLLKQT